MEVTKMSGEGLSSLADRPARINVGGGTASIGVGQVSPSVVDPQRVVVADDPARMHGSIAS
jgi:hypothetical protein